MKYQDYYEVLGVPPSATLDDIKRTYRKLARKYHPDLSKLDDAESRFKEVGEAYGVLKDTEKRAAYDRMGDQWRDGQEFEPPPQWDEGFEFSGADDSGAGNPRFSEFFEAFFRGEHAGGGRASTGRARQAAGAGRENATAQEMEDAYAGVPHSAPGQDHHAKVVIDLTDTYRGAQRTISLETPVLDASGRVVTEVTDARCLHSRRACRWAAFAACRPGGRGFRRGTSWRPVPGNRVAPAGTFPRRRPRCDDRRAGCALGGGIRCAHYRADARRHRRNSRTERF